MIVENFPNMKKEIVNQVQEAQRIPYRINPRRNMPRHILIKLTKTKHKERISEVDDKMLEITSEEQNKVKRMKRTEDSLRDLWDNNNCTNI